MRRALLLGLIVAVLAMGGIGAAYAGGMGFTEVGALSLGVEEIPEIDADYIGFHLSSAYTLPVTVDGVYISLDTSIDGTNAVSVSVRAANGDSLAYYAANDVTWDEGTTYLVDLIADGADLPTADQVHYVKVVVATNSRYN